MKEFNSLAAALQALYDKGYCTDFTTEAISLYCGEFDIRLDPDDFHVDEYYELSAAAGSDAGKIVYAITAVTGIKGTLVHGAKTYTATINARMAQKLRLDE